MKKISFTTSWVAQIETNRNFDEKDVICSVVILGSKQNSTEFIYWSSADFKQTTDKIQISMI